MIGIWQSYSVIYLIAAGVVMLAAFGLPMVLAPMSWARVFRWKIPQQQELASFMARSVGVIMIILTIFAFKAVRNPTIRPFFFNLMLWIFGGMILLHAYGAIRKTQPATETIEILLWIVMSLVTLGFYPG